ncbi:hypothetical protein DSL64_03785 [Dyadobacter luteus]|uniref:Uncharacterized protein n=1 Tax=Dyadobacter luteus TaxID=2259619 RepID=A0A3D8YG93_9BACT|nr:hypothetical protein [Dyadobacter luteus]REA63574.1 hypothetical protein DSL64_03785 [Dyadobacter luteus]
MDLQVVGKTRDLRTSTDIIYGQINIDDYLNLIGEDYDKYGIQRRREKHKAYNRMKNDIKAGALLPTITLAVNKGEVDRVLDILNNQGDDELKKVLETPGIFSILDGLQRTYILHDIREEGHEFNKDQKLLLEFWVEKNPKHIIYRLIVLNAGQKPMSLRHQIELLFMTLEERIKESIPGLEIFREAESRRKSRAGQFVFERLVASYQSFLWKTQELNKSNIVAQQLMEDSVTDSSESDLNDSFERYIFFLEYYTQIDTLAYKYYLASEDGSKINWLSLENVMISFFAAISDFGVSRERENRISKALNNLLDQLASKIQEDPLGLDIYYKLLKGFEIRKINVGVATRKLLFNGFKEFFREEGEKKLSDCWTAEA